MYNVHLPIMLESERQAVYRERKKDTVFLGSVALPTESTETGQTEMLSALRCSALSALIGSVKIKSVITTHAHSVSSVKVL